MGLVYFKRFRMELDLRRWRPAPLVLPPGYELVPFRRGLIEAHAATKYQCFRWELDANVFPCLGDASGCLRLMNDIVRRDGFERKATWLARYQPGEGCPAENCGTIQGVFERRRVGSIQNVGVTPAHRGLGVGACLVNRSLEGFLAVGVRRVALEVTAENGGAVRLYERLGFVRVRTLYKAVEMAFS